MPIASSVFVSPQSTKLPGETSVADRSGAGLTSKSRTRRSADGYGSRRINTPFTTLNAAVFRPMPTASVTNALTARTGLRQSTRSP
jgi:hypothetical protein